MKTFVLLDSHMPFYPYANFFFVVMEKLWARSRCGAEDCG